MAECMKSKDTQSTEGGSQMECAVCLQNCVHPAQLPCGHIFCFLCVKGIANQSKRCAMCRQEIPSDFLEHPKLLDIPEVKETGEEFEGGYQWFYEGRNGWWKYDERSNEEIEEAYKQNLKLAEILICGELYAIDFDQKVQYPKRNSSRKRYIKRDLKNITAKGVAGWWQYDERTSKELELSYKAGERTCELLIAGFLYIADFDSMVQRRRNDPARRRRIKRDLATIPKKGIAGLKFSEDQSTSQERSESPIMSNSTNCPTPPVTPSDNPQTPVETQGNDEATIESLQSTMQSLTLLSRDENYDDDDDQNHFYTRRYFL